jgi:glyoxylase-like metal-dependent hydrolase (beta-lactamase superfamily II)
MGDWHREPAPADAIPTLTFADSMVLHLNGQAVRLLHAPAAHTGGDAMVVFPRENVIHMGDILELGAYPFLDWWSGGSLDGVLAAVDRVLAMADDDTRIVPGHGRVVDRQGLADYRGMLVTVRDRVQAAVAEGKSLDEMSATLPTKEFDASYGGERQGRRFARLIYYGLTRPGA